MIFFLNGTIKHLGANYLVLETNGIGYQVFVTTNLLGQIHIGEEAQLWIDHIINDAGQTLFGFPSLDERSFFEQLLTVNGVGGKTALNLMSLAPVKDLQSAIRSGDVAILTRVSGIGKRTAERIIVELKEKLGSGEIMTSSHGEAFDALTSLGYSASDIRQVLQQLPSTLADTEKIIKDALKKLGGKK